MENKPQQTSPIKDPKQSKAPYVVMIVILLLTSVVLGWMWYQAEKKVEYVMVQVGNVKSEKKALEAELEDMLSKYQNMETDNAEMRAKIAAQQSKIEQLLEEAKKHKGDAWRIYKLKKETETLRTIMKGYVHTIDSLNTLNIQLREEKAQISSELNEEKERSSTLQSEKQNLEKKVKLGSRLQALNMESIAQRVKRNNVHRPTRRAEKAEKIRTCFTLSENEIAKTGNKEIYLRIIGPDGNVLAIEDNETYFFDYEGVEGLYSVKKTVNYNRKELDLCMYWDVMKGLKEGVYTIEAYADELKIGESKLELK